jgi:Ca2+-binding RTX toxin-like protein
LGTGATFVPGGTITVPAARTLDAAGNPALQDVAFTVPALPPAVVSIAPDPISGATAESVDYTVVFSAPVTGVTPDDFTVTGGGGAQGTVTAVSGSGTTYTVKVATQANTAGTLRLDLNSSGTGIEDGNDLAIVGGFTSGTTHAVDRVAPPAPSITGISDDTGAADGITRDATLTISGTAEANATVEVFQGGTSLGTAPADANGSWSLDLSGSPFTDGPSTLTAKATDAAGNESSLSSPFQLTVDTAGAQLLSIMREALSGAATNVNTLTYQVTFNETVIGVDAADFTVSGGSTATVSSVTPVGISGTVYDVTVSGGDLASFNGAVGLSLKSGHTITDVAANPLANSTPAGADESYSLDNTPPAEPTFSTVAGDGTISEGDRTTGVTLTGSTDLGSTVTLSIEGQSRAAIVAGATWTYTLQDADYSALGEGSKTITATAMDAVGNVSTVGSVSFTVDTVAPPAPTVLAVADADNALFNAGFSVASGAAVTLIGASLSDFTKSADGGLDIYTAKAGGFTGSETIEVSATVKDAAGNTSAAGTLSLANVDTTAPTAPALTPSDDATGVAVGSNLVLTFGENIAKGTGFIELRSSDGTLIEQFSAANSPALTFSGYTLTINPTANLSYATGYYVMVANTAVVDLAGNAFAGITDETVFTFTTQAAPPPPPPPGPTPGDDTLVGTSGNDTVNAGGGNDSVSGGAGNDSLSGNEGADTLGGGDGNDSLFGGADNDLVMGGNDDDLVFGGEGNDTALGGTGEDTIYGGNGNDQVFAGEGNDEAGGGAGSDTLYAGAGNDTLYGGADSDTVLGGDGNDVLAGGDGEDAFTGGAGDDEVATGAGNDTVYAGVGNDEVFGAVGDDLQYGGAGADTLYGGAGADTLSGGADDDVLFGGADGDVFFFTGPSGNDVINGFSFEDGDRLDLDGQGYTLAAQAGGVLVSLEDGGTILLTGLTQDQVQSSWFV